MEPDKFSINTCSYIWPSSSLRTAVDIDGTLDKEATSYNDIFDAFRLALKFYSYRDSSDYDWLKVCMEVNVPTSVWWRLILGITVEMKLLPLLIILCNYVEKTDSSQLY